MELSAYLHKVQYYETDQMQIVHHSNYIRWFEEARMDFMEQLGAGYDKMEKAGCISPVVSVSCDYRNMTRFGETVFVYVTLERFNGVKLELSYEVTEEKTGNIRARGKSSHCFIDSEGHITFLKKENGEFYQKLMEAVGKGTGNEEDG